MKRTTNPTPNYKAVANAINAEANQAAAERAQLDEVKRGRAEYAPPKKLAPTPAPEGSPAQADFRINKAGEAEW